MKCFEALQKGTEKCWEVNFFSRHLGKRPRDKEQKLEKETYHLDFVSSFWLSHFDYESDHWYNNHKHGCSFGQRKYTSKNQNTLIKIITAIITATRYSMKDGSFDGNCFGVTTRKKFQIRVKTS